MKKTKRRQRFDTTFTQKVIPESLIDTTTSIDDYDKKQLKTRSAYFMLNGAPEFAVNDLQNGRYKLRHMKKTAERAFLKNRHPPFFICIGRYRNGPFYVKRSE